MFTIALFFDERSMISQHVLGSAELNISTTAHSGGHETEDWGGIPVIVVFGDDYQLPPPATNGAIDALFNQGNTAETRKGAHQFIKSAESTSELMIIM